MIKVLNIISDSNIGGAGRCILNYLKYYNREEFAIKVVVPKRSLLIPEITKLRVMCIECDYISDKSFDKDAIKALSDIIKRENPHIVHTHGNLSGRIAGRLCGKKVIYTRHSVFPVSSKIRKIPGRWVNKCVNEFLADDIMAVAEAAKENLTDGGIAPHKIKVVLNGVERIEQLTLKEKEAAKADYEIGNDEFVIGILARMEEYKGHRYLIEACEMLKMKGKNCKVLIVGTGPIEEELQQLVKEKDLSDMIIFTGFIKNVRSVLGIMDLQINASFGTEATSLSLLEGMSLGIPAIVSDYGGNTGVITHGKNGIVVPMQKSEKIAEAIALLMEYPEAYEHMQEGSLQIYKEKFTGKIYARNIEEVYRGVL